MTAIGILYVEDNDDLRESIAMMLEADDRDITSCATAEEALAALQRRDYDILITDVSLPGISGTDLAKRVTADKPDQWVILCSGYQFDHGLKTLGKNVRAILKPFEIEDMDNMLAEIIGSLART